MRRAESVTFVLKTYLMHETMLDVQRNEGIVPFLAQTRMRYPKSRYRCRYRAG